MDIRQFQRNALRYHPLLAACRDEQQEFLPVVVETEIVGGSGRGRDCRWDGGWHAIDARKRPGTDKGAHTIRCLGGDAPSQAQTGLLSITVVIFLLRSGESSESMANHDSEIMVWLCSCRSDAGSSGVGTEGCERSDAAVVRAGANGGECRLVSGWVAQRGAA